MPWSLCQRSQLTKRADGLQVMPASQSNSTHSHDRRVFELRAMNGAFYLASLALSLSLLLATVSSAPVSDKDSSVLVRPSRTDENGEHVSFDLLPPAGEGQLSGERIHFRIDALGKRFRLNVSDSGGSFLSGEQMVEYRHRQLGVRTQALSGRDGCRHFTGSVLEETAEGQLVDETGWTAFSYCRGLRGVIATGASGYLYIEPEGEVLDHPHTHSHPHLLLSAPHLGPETTCNYEKTGSSEHSGTPRDEVRVRRSSDSSSLSSEHWVEVAVVADHTMLEYHGARELEAYLFTLMNMVSHLYRHPSIGHAVNIVVVRTVILETQQNDLSISSDGLNSLTSFCSWQASHPLSSSAQPDVSLLLTRANICEGFGGTCGTLGIAEFRGACSAGKSCSINEDIGLATAFTIAHELGHSLGMRHDGDMSVVCEPDNHFIMAPTFAQSHNPHIWSHCSRQQLTQFLLSPESSCLSNRPVTTGANSSSGRVPLPGLETTPTEQCQLMLGNHASHCGPNNSTDFCSRLWCRADNQSECVHRHIPPAAGTECVLSSGGEGVCYQGSCVEFSSLAEAVDGGWGEWGNWEPCSLSCGTGVQGSSRSCDSPFPANGGRYCLGASHRHQTCNSTPCPAPSDIRQELCDSEPPHSRFSQWQAPSLEYILRRNLDQCSHHCLGKPDDVLFTLTMGLPDGTPCHFTAQPSPSLSLNVSSVPESLGVCVSGECVPMGCDHALHGMASRDTCGVWCGNGSTCVSVSDTYTIPEVSVSGISDYVYHRTVTIPRGSGQVKVSELHPTHNLYLAATTDTENFNGNYRVKEGELGSYWFAGAKWWYERPEGGIECLRTAGVVKDDVTIFIIANSRNLSIRYSAGVPLGNASIFEVDYEWRTGGWGKCGEVCGEGVRGQRVECVVSETEIVVRDDLCDLSAKPLGEEVCFSDDGCEYEWRGDPWSDCNTTCGAGEKSRTIHCILSHNQTVVEESHCENETAPPRRTECQSELGCVYQWQTGGWGSCSSACGVGQREREVTCILVNSLAEVGPEMCGGLRPSSHGDCYSERGCVFEWNATSWSRCDSDCGWGERERGVACLLTNNNTEVDGGHCGQTEPETSSPCHSEEGCVYTWQYGNWTSCSAECGQGTRSRDVACYLRNNNTEVDRNRCPSNSQPAEFTSCHDDSGCVYVWAAEPWTECDNSCGGGHMTRRVSCLLTNNQTTARDQELCLSDSRPVSEETCYSERHCQFEWQSTGWGPCSAVCGGGEREREVSCLLNNNRTTVDREFCRDAGARPQSVGACGEEDCQFEWRLGEWGVCGLVNAESACEEGKRWRRTECVLVNNRSVVEEIRCEVTERPSESSICRVPGCSYVWAVGDWGSCNAGCGEGQRERDVHCEQRLSGSGVGERVEGERCGELLTQQPSQREVCSAEPCNNFDWDKGAWSKCDAECGQSGSQTREVTCKHRNGTVVPDTPYCTTGKPKPTETKSCRGDPCPPPVVCVDAFRTSCGVVLRLQLCHIPRFRNFCCQSCS